MIDAENGKLNDSISKIDPYDYPSKTSGKSHFPIIAGILLVIAGIISMLYFIFIMSLDIIALESFVDINQFKSIDPNITMEQVKGFFNLCSGIFIVISIFPILGGILSFRKKLWGIALACSIVGLLSIGPVFISSILCLIALIFVAISKQEFQ